MTAPLPLSPAPLRQVAGESRAGRLTRLLEFWLSGRMLLIGTTGFLAGYLLMWNAEMQFLWLVVTCHPAFLAWCLRKHPGEEPRLTRDPLLRLAAAFIVWNLTIGLLRHSDAFAVPYTGSFFAGALLLPVYLGSVWVVCRMKNGVTWINRALMAAGVIAAVTGLIYWRCFQVFEEPGARLRNLLVHGGQHPVSTAMCLSFALVVAAMSYRNLRPGAQRAGLLAALAVMMLAIMLTLSRGALVALACVPLAFMLALTGATFAALVKRKPVSDAIRPYGLVVLSSWPQMITVAGVAVAFLFYGGHLAPTPAPPPDIPANVEVIHRERLNPAPLDEYFVRESNGRTVMYQLGLACVDTWDKHLFGAGLWGPEIRLQEITSKLLGSAGNNHFHSIYIATYIHGGIVGSALFAMILVVGLRRALILVRAGQPQWLALIAFGLGAVIVDGHSLCSLRTHPRFESFILWFPLVAASACAGRLQTAGRQPSSSESR